MKSSIWKHLEKIYAEGLVHSIGVSNYNFTQLEALLSTANTAPAVNQVQFHSFSYKKELLDFCKSKNIVLQGYSPLARGKRINDPIITDMARKYNRTPAQVMIRWSLQKGVVPIPKSSHRNRIIENANVFDFQLGDNDMKLLDRE